MRDLLREIWWTVWTFALANFVAFIVAPINYSAFWAAVWLGVQS